MVVKKRNIALFVLLNTLTLGIYGLVVLSMMSSEIEQICEGDGKKQMPYILAWLLGAVTLGIVPLIWFRTAMNRLQDNAYRYGDLVRPQYSGDSYVLWFLLGIFIVVGPIVALCQYLSDVNAFAGIAGNVRPLPYTPNPVERMNLINQARSEGSNPMSFAGINAGPVNPVNPVNPGLPMTPPAAPQNPVDSKVSPIDTTTIQKPVEQEPSGGIDGVNPTRPAAGSYHGKKTGTVTCINGMYKDIPFPISDGEEMIIGTDPSSCNIIISQNNIYVSRKHCTIKYSIAGDTYTVIDHSTNGTFCSNGQQLAKNAPKALRKGDTIHLGDANNSYKFG